MSEKELMICWNQLCSEANEMSFADFQTRIKIIGAEDPKVKDLVLDGLLSSYPARNAATKILMRTAEADDVLYLIRNASKICYDSACYQLSRNVRYFMTVQAVTDFVPDGCGRRI